MRQLTVPTRSDGFSHVDGMSRKHWLEALAEWYERQSDDYQSNIRDEINEHEAQKAAA